MPETYDSAGKAYRFKAGSAPGARQNLAALTVSVGTGDGTVADVGAAFNQATLNNNFRDVADKINEIIAALEGLDLAD